MNSVLKLIRTNKQPSLAGQILAVMVGCVLLSQVFMIWIFSDSLRDRVNAIRAHGTVARLVPTYQMVDSLPQTQRDELMTLINSFESQYFVFSQQANGDTFDGIEFHETQNFQHELPNVTVYKSEKEFGVVEMLKFWFSNSLNNCFLNDDQAFLTPGCPYEVHKIRLSDNSWFVAKTNPPPVVAVVLGPVLASGLVTLLLMLITIRFAVRRLTAPLNSLSRAAERLGPWRSRRPY